VETLKVLLLAVSISLGVALVGTLIVSLGMDSLERLRQRWVAREREGAKIVHA
jgi:hypothetical protein